MNVNSALEQATNAQWEKSYSSKLSLTPALDAGGVVNACPVLFNHGKNTLVKSSSQATPTDKQIMCMRE
jgi:hypothetical protein